MDAQNQNFVEESDSTTHLFYKQLHETDELLVKLSQDLGYTENTTLDGYQYQDFKNLSYHSGMPGRTEYALDDASSTMTDLHQYQSQNILHLQPSEPSETATAANQLQNDNTSDAASYAQEGLTKTFFNNYNERDSPHSAQDLSDGKEEIVQRRGSAIKTNVRASAKSKTPYSKTFVHHTFNPPYPPSTIQFEARDDTNEILPVVVCHIGGCNTELHGYEEWKRHLREGPVTEGNAGCPAGHGIISRRGPNVICPWDGCGRRCARPKLLYHIILHGMINFECRLCDYSSNMKSNISAHVTGNHLRHCDQSLPAYKYHSEVRASTARKFWHRRN